MSNDLRRWMRLLEATAKMPSGFKRWFGKSKVVDDQGAPLLVYHGTKDRSFTEFDPAKIKSGVGFWFTSDRLQAFGHTQSIDRRGRTIHGRVIAAYLSLQNPATTVKDYMRGTDADGNAYDGYMRAELDLYVAFRPDQIKIVDQGLA
jgi:hypothetical protein